MSQRPTLIPAMHFVHYIKLCMISAVMSIIRRARESIKLSIKFYQPIYFRIPIWPYAKLIVTCWLVLPYFSGAAYVYEHYVRPLFVNPQTINIWYVPSKKDKFGKPDDILTAAENYIQENGTEAFENLINRVFPYVKLGYCRIIHSFISNLLY